MKIECSIGERKSPKLFFTISWILVKDVYFKKRSNTMCMKP